VSYAKLLSELDTVEDLIEGIYEELIEVRAMIDIAQRMDIKVDCDVLVGEFDFENNGCSKMLIKINILLLKLKGVLLENGIFLTKEDLLRWLFEIKVRRI
jgi:hypothetical protein